MNDAYEPNDPKNPTYVGSLLDWADEDRKRRKEQGGYRVSEHTTPEEQAALVRSLERGE